MIRSGGYAMLVGEKSVYVVRVLVFSVEINDFLYGNFGALRGSGGHLALR